MASDGFELIEDWVLASHKSCLAMIHNHKELAICEKLLQFWN